jgi:hypothetical protein
MGTKWSNMFLKNSINGSATLKRLGHDIDFKKIDEETYSLGLCAYFCDHNLSKVGYNFNFITNYPLVKLAGLTLV